ncbi:IS1272 transposase, putative [Staphylococcus aureus subsp. aureus 6850]|nr:IS1272 transposase, putative [Staphylococcus aureus subsp. aureus 6850]
MINFNKTALVLIDLQEGILKMDYAPYTAENVVQNANKLIDVFRKNNSFIVFVRVKFYDGKDALKPNSMVSLPPKEGDDYSRFHHLLDKRDGDFVIDKRQFSAFVGTDLDLQLRRRGIDTIVLGGVATHVGVDTTARDAYQLNYDQYFVTDMMSAQNETLHQFPIETSVRIPQNDISRYVNEIVETIPDSEFDEFRHHRGATSYHPKMMLKIILYAYTQSVFSGRRIEKLLHDSIRMMWLAQDQTPSYKTINRFRVNPNTDALIESLFIQFHSQCLKQNLIDDNSIFIDGTKVEASANRYTFVWKKSIQNHESKLNENSKALYRDLVEEKIIPEIKEDGDSDLTIEEIDLIGSHLDKEIEDLNHSIENEDCTQIRKQTRKKRTEIKKFKKKFDDYSERKSKYEEQKSILKDRNSFSKTDHDATFMRMKEDHMKNGQLKPGYNLQIATNSQFVLSYDLFQNPTDTRTLIPFLTMIQNTFGYLPEYIVADAGYGSEQNYMAIIDDFNKTPLITYGMFIKDKTRKFKSDIFNTQNWKYDELNDEFICPNNKRIGFKRYAYRNDRYGFKRDFKLYECDDCSACSLRQQCMKPNSKSNKKIMKNYNWEYFKAQINQKLSEPETKKIYSQRKIDVEPVFGFMKAILGFTRMSVRGINKVKRELGFVLMALNIRKIAARRAVYYQIHLKKADFYQIINRNQLFYIA